jgi:hypothetical protein
MIFQVLQRLCKLRQFDVYKINFLEKHLAMLVL